LERPVARVRAAPPPSITLPTPQFSRKSSAEKMTQSSTPVTTDKGKDVVEVHGDVRPFEDCLGIFESGPGGVDALSDEEVIMLAQKGKIAAYALEKVLRDFDRAVKVRRALICEFFVSCSQRYILMLYMCSSCFRN
jgi:hydroxymethylglutaryl-CoA reductase (NADPH)